MGGDTSQDFITRGVHSQGQKRVAIEAKQGKLEVDMASGEKHTRETIATNAGYSITFF